MPKTILIIGATGKQGAAVVHALQPHSPNEFTLRTMTRNPASPAALSLSNRGVEVYKGDFHDLNSLKAAMNGCWGLFFMTDAWGKGGIPAEVQQGKNVVDAAMEAGVEYVVFSSVGGLSKGKCGVPHFDSKFEVEEYLKSKTWKHGWAILRPTAFFENFDSDFSRPLRGQVSFVTKPKTKFQVIATKDIGAFAALAFLRPDEFKGKALELAGDCISGEDLAEALAKAQGIPYTYSQAIPLFVLRFLNYDLWRMIKFFEEEGYKADIPELKKLKPDLMDVHAWIKYKGFDKPEAFAAPKSKVPVYVGAAAVVGVVAISAAYIWKK
ncbi:hypothetical protein HK102_011525 [Quaeritorhiza haematococci]|nr:hypothetical protein HK102_011525 [Quaeritorhiza haematococci]